MYILNVEYNVLKNRISHNFLKNRQIHILFVSCIGMWVLYHQHHLGSPIWKICCSVTQSCLTLCDPTGCSMPGFPVLYHLPEFVQTHVHWVGEAIESSHPLSSPSPPAFNLSQHQGLWWKIVVTIFWRTVNMVSQIKLQLSSWNKISRGSLPSCIDVV